MQLSAAKYGYVSSTESPDKFWSTVDDTLHELCARMGRSKFGLNAAYYEMDQDRYGDPVVGIVTSPNPEFPQLKEKGNVLQNAGVQQVMVVPMVKRRMPSDSRRTGIR
ncbi:hypothetical protein EDD85DRAFT_783352 [Armillaria nabsnona]|nr:hypothetical protein EDD85DRAFT_783352 [Armillaria nabsnona]